MEKEVGEKKKLLCSGASPSEIRHQLGNQDTIPYHPATFSCIRYQTMSES